MILADKIIENRKKNGWSQEELADRLGVSRQAVSKWESAQAVPDMKKILQLAELFGVTTDYLLKDEIEDIARPAATPVESGLEETARKVTMEEANAFLAHSESAARTISTGVMLCILSPVLMILLAGMAESGRIPVGEDAAGACGVAILLIMIAAAVGMFIMTGLHSKPYEYLESLNVDTEYGVTGMVKERRLQYAGTHSRLLIGGIMLCVVSAIPIFLAEMFNYSNNTDLLPVVSVAALLTAVAVGVKMIVLTCIRQGAFDKLLEEGDYSRMNKRASKYDGIYWAIATTVYLGWSFITFRWEFTWIVWPIAGVLFGAYKEIAKAIIRSRNG